MSHDPIYNETADDHHALAKKLRQYWRGKGYVGVVIQSSGTSAKSGTHFCYMKCSQGGEPKADSQNRIESNTKKTSGSAAELGFDPQTHFKCANGVVKKRPERSTIRMGCPYKVYASKTKGATKYSFNLENDKTNLVHTCRNEDERADLRIDPSAGKDEMTHEVITQIIQQSSVGMTPSQILRLMRINNPTTMIDTRRISRILEKASVENSRADEFSSITSKLRTGNYLYRYEITEEGVLNNLFVAHKDSISKARQFPEVVIIDATYKTSLAKLPLVHIVGVDNLASDKSTDSLRTFFIAYVLINNETKDTYAWLLNCLKSNIYNTVDGVSRTPGLFVTDNDHALRNTLKAVFPSVPHSLCAWHMQMNFESKLEKNIDESARKRYVAAVLEMLYGRSLNDFIKAKKKYYAVTAEMPNKDSLQKYLGSLLYYQEKWAGAWTANRVNLGVRSTQRVEGTHAAIKEIIQTPGKISKIIGCIHTFLEEGELKRDKEAAKERYTRILQKDPTKATIDQDATDILKPLEHVLGHFAIRRMRQEIDKAREAAVDVDTGEYTACHCAIRSNYRLPCYHDLLRNSNSTEIIIDPSTIDNRWYLDRNLKCRPFHSFSIPRTAEAVDDKFQKMLSYIEAEYARCPDDQQKLNFIDCITKAVTTFKVIPIKDISVVQSVTPRGRPSATIGSRILSRFEQQAPSPSTTSPESSRFKETKRKRKDDEEPGSTGITSKDENEKAELIKSKYERDLRASRQSERRDNVQKEAKRQYREKKYQSNESSKRADKNVISQASRSQASGSKRKQVNDAVPIEKLVLCKKRQRMW